jgi:hypothetical protein
LDELDKPGNILAARAAGLKSQLCSASTLFALQMAKEVFTPLENLNRSLQASYQTVAGMLEAIEMTQQELYWLFVLMIPSTQNLLAWFTSKKNGTGTRYKFPGSESRQQG